MRFTEGDVSRWTVLVGGIGILVVGIFYASSSVSMTLPTATAHWQAGFEEARLGPDYLPWITFIGLPSDVLLVVGAIGRASLVRDTALGARREICFLGWVLVGLGAFLFMGNDLLGGQVLPSLAQSDNRSAYLSIRALYDALFTVASVMYAAGVALHVRSLRAPESVRRGLTLGVALTVVGVVLSFKDVAWSGIVMGGGTVWAAFTYSVLMAHELRDPLRRGDGVLLPQ